MIKISKEQKSEIIDRIKNYFESELDYEIGGLQSEFLLDFFIKEIGPYFYNQALDDCRALVAKQMDNVADKIYELEKPVNNIQ